MAGLPLTPEREAEARRLAAVVGQKVQEERMARLPASKPRREPLGATGFEVRERVHALGAHALGTAVNGRKKGGAKGRA